MALRTHISHADAPQEYDYTPGYYAVFFADPDGMKLEVVYEPVARGERVGAVCKAKVCERANALH